jgi:UDP-N-acetylglucosamine acyltransferase
VHRATKADGETQIGSNNLLMANCHVGHNCDLGSHVIIANGALLGGHVTVQDRVFISGNCLVHQFVRVGTLALMQGGSAISMDLPPFCVAQRGNEICGLNVIGLRRTGFTAEQRLELKKLYHALFRSGKSLRTAIAAAREIFSSAPAKILLEFAAGAKRGVCSDLGHKNSESEDV